MCSGIEAATVAWEPLGWKAVGFSEIDAFPRAVLAHRYPHVPLHGDFTALIADPPSCDVLVGGTPCQAFSVAGARQSLDDARGNLSLAYVELANAIDRKNYDSGKAACIVVWENVPGVFSTKDNAFGCFLAGLAGEDGPLEPPGGRWTNCGAVRGPQRAVAWRVLDAQYFGLAQRRRRVFVVASARNGFDPTQVLLESEGVRRDSAPSREARKDPAADLGVSPAPRGGENAGKGRYLRNAEGGAGEVPFLTSSNLGKCVNNQTPLVGVTGDSASACWCPDVSGPLGGAGQSGGFRTTDLDNNGAYILDAPVAFAVHENQRAEVTLNDTAGTVKCAGGKPGQGYPAVLAVALRGRDGGNTAELGGEIQSALRTGGGGSDKPHVLAPFAFEPRHYTRDNKTGGAPSPLVTLTRDSKLGDSTPHVLAPVITDAVPFSVAFGAAKLEQISQAITANGGPNRHGEGSWSATQFTGVIAPSSTASSSPVMAVRRLTPRECERLQGFPDDWTLVPWRGKPCPDGPRYKALGNSMAVPVMRWIGRRIDEKLRERP